MRTAKDNTNMPKRYYRPKMKRCVHCQWKLKRWYKKHDYKDKINRLLLENAEEIRKEVKLICMRDLGFNEAKAEAYASVFVMITRKVADKWF